VNKVGTVELAILAKHGYGIMWNPDKRLFWPIIVHDGECVAFWPDSGDVADDDYLLAVSKLYTEVQNDLAEMGAILPAKDDSKVIPNRGICGWVYDRNGD